MLEISAYCLTNETVKILLDRSLLTVVSVLAKAHLVFGYDFLPVEAHLGIAKSSLKQMMFIRDGNQPY